MKKRTVIVTALVTAILAVLLPTMSFAQSDYPRDVLERYWDCQERNDLTAIKDLLWYHQNVEKIDASIYGLPVSDFDDQSLLTINERLRAREEKTKLGVRMATSGSLQYAHHLRQSLDHHYEVTGERLDCSEILGRSGVVPIQEQPRALGGWVSDLNLTISDTSDRGEVDLAIDFANPNRVMASAVAAGAVESSDHIVYTDDWGQSWTETQVGNNSGTSWECDPVSYYQRSTGNVYHSKIGCTTGTCGSTLTLMRFSTNNGASWADCGRPDSETSEDRQWHVVDNNAASACYGNIYITWHNSNQEKVTRSTDDCASWDTPDDLTGTFSAITPDINVAADGKVYVAWQNYSDATFKFSRSDDCGQTWTAGSTVKTRLGDWKNNIPAQCQRGISTMPNVDVDRCPWSANLGRVYMTFFDFNKSGCGTGPGCSAWTDTCNYDIYFTYSDDDGVTWRRPSDDAVGIDNLTAGEGDLVDHFQGYMRVDESDGSIYIGHQRSTLNPTALSDRQQTHQFIRRSTDGGKTWEVFQSSTLISDEQVAGGNSFERGDYAKTDVYAGVVWPVWIDRRCNPTCGEEELIVRKVCTEPAHRSERAPTFTAPPTTMTSPGAGTVDVAWTAPDAHWGDAGESPAQRKFQLWVDGGLAQDNIAWDGSLTVTNYDPGDCNSHDYAIRAINQCGITKDYATASFSATGCCPQNPVNLDVTPDGPLTLCVGTSQGLSLTFTDGSDGGSSSYSYQWYRDGGAIPSANSNTYTANDTATHGYNCEVTENSCGSGVQDSIATQITWQDAPNFAGIQTVTNNNDATCTLDLTWNAATSTCPGPFQYKIYRSTTSGFTPALGNLIATVGTLSHSDTDNLTSGTTYYYVVRATDTGTAVEESNLVELSGIPRGPIGNATWMAGAEVGDPGMLTNGGWAFTTARVNSGTNSYIGVHADNLCGALITPELPLSGGQSSVLTFWVAYDIENQYDGAVVEISTNSPAFDSWSILTPTPGYPGTFRNSSDACGYATNQACYTNTNLTFAQYTIDLSAYNDPTPGTDLPIVLRWNYSTDASVGGEGIYVDDIAVTNVQSQTACATGSSCTIPDDPADITSTTDVSNCAQSGITVVYTASTDLDVTRHDLVQDGSVVVTDYASGAVFDPADTLNHTYKIRAVDGSCILDSAGSDRIDVDATPTAPAAPIVTDTNSCAASTVSISWTTTGGETYDLWVDDVQVATGISSPYTAYNPGDQASHKYEIEPNASGCVGALSGATNFAESAGLAAPGAPTVTDDNACAQSGVTVTWGAVGGADQYDLRVDGAPGTVIANVTSPYSYDPTDTASHSYEIMAKDTGNGCQSSWSGVTNATDANDTPAAPTSLAASATVANQIDLTWSGSGATYDIYRGTSTGGPYGLVGSTAATSYSDTTVSNGIEYFYVVQAVSATSCPSANSNEGSAIAFGDCTQAPTFAGLTSATVGASSCEVTLSWSAGTSNCGGQLVYNAYRSTTSGFTPGPANLLSACVTETFLMDTSGVVNTTYYYAVRAEDSTSAGAGDCNSGNTDANVVEQNATVTGATQNGSQLTTPISATSTTVSSDFDISHTIETSSFAEVNYNLSYTGSGGTEVVTAPDVAATNKNNPYTTTFTPATTTAAGNATVASVTYSSIAGWNKFTTGFPRVRNTSATTPTWFILLQPAARGAARTTDITTDYNGANGGVGTWEFQAQFTKDNSNVLTISMTVDASGAGTLVANSQVQLVSPGGTRFDLKTYGANPPTPIDVTTIYNAATGGPGLWAIEVSENVGGEARLSAATLNVTGTTCYQPSAEVLSLVTATSTSTQNLVEWLTPSSGACSTIRVVRKTGSYPTGPFDGGATLVGGSEVACGGLNTAGWVIDSSLTNGTLYYYGAYVNDGDDQFSPITTVTGRPEDTGVASKVKWIFNSGASALAPPGIGSVYGVSNDRMLHSMTPGSTGGDWPAAWKPMAMNAPAQGRPPIMNFTGGGPSGCASCKVTFIASQDGSVYAVNADSGAQLWATTDVGLIQGGARAILTDFGGITDRVLAGSRNSGLDNVFYGFAVADGTTNASWSFDNGGGANGIGIISGGPSVDYQNSRVYFASRSRAGGSSNTLWALNLTGSGFTTAWSVALGDIDGSPIMVRDFAGNAADDRIYVGTNAGTIVAVDAATGTTIWTSSYCSGDGAVKGHVWPDNQSTQLFVATTGSVCSISDGDTAAVNGWTTAVAGASVPLFAPSTNYMFVGSSDGRLYQMDSTTGAVTTSQLLGDGSATVGSPALDVVNDLMYAGTESGAIYAVMMPLQ